jgi:hypothetical protein
MKTVALEAIAASFAGCASHSSDIAAAYVSPIQYQSFTCAQLSEEAARVSSRAAIANGAQDQKATGDAVATGVGVVILASPIPHKRRRRKRAAGRAAQGRHGSDRAGKYSEEVRSSIPASGTTFA